MNPLIQEHAFTRKSVAPRLGNRPMWRGMNPTTSVASHIRWVLTVAGVAVAFALVPAGDSQAASAAYAAKAKCPAGTVVADYCAVERRTSRKLVRRHR